MGKTVNIKLLNESKKLSACGESGRLPNQDDDNAANQQANCLANKEGSVNNYKQVRAASKVFFSVWDFFLLKLGHHFWQRDRILTREAVDNHSQYQMCSMPDLSLCVASTADETKSLKI